MLQPRDDVCSPAQYLSCDDLTDAIRSLALAYDVPISQIDETYRFAWPDFLPPDVENEFFTDDRLSWIMNQHMKCGDTANRGLHAAYYHRALYDGTPSWFSTGLHGSLEGASHFLIKLRAKLPSTCDFDTIKALVISNIIERTGFEGECGGGPYAFDRLEDAINAQVPGCDYSAPEFLMGNIWNITAAGECSANRLRQICKQEFRPVVVKFLGAPVSNNRYINNLWHYLHRKRFKICVTPNHYTFSGKGNLIPPERIKSLIELAQD